MEGFNTLGWAGVGCGLAFVALSFLIKGWSHGADGN
jgi:POT family proton-dependent oligopeptide transporter